MTEQPGLDSRQVVARNFWEDSRISKGTTGDISSIYDTYIQSILHTEQRRSQLSAIYASIVGLALTSLGFKEEVNLVFPALAVLLISSLWLSKVKYLQSLARFKWETAAYLEEYLVVRPFTDEYHRITRARKSNEHSRRRLSDFEVMLPRGLQICAALYLLYWTMDRLLPVEWRFWEAIV